jgi:hypothetical protein
VDSVWEQEKPEVRKMLENAAESHTSGAPRKSGAHFSRQKPSSGWGKYTPGRQIYKLPYGQSSGGMPKRQPRGAPWLPVSLIYALVARGEKTPMRKLIPIRDRVLSITDQE